MAISAGSALAIIPEPDNVFYGLVSTNATQHFTAADTNVVVQARALPSGPALATYTMGSKPALGDYYSIRLSLESLQPISSPQAFQPGGTVYLTVVSPTGILAQQSATVLGRGQLTRVDLGSGGPDYSAYLKHPADNSPADNSISSAELNAYSTAWRSGQAWPLGPNPIPIGYVTRAGALWAAGGTYVFDSSQVASAPVNAPEWWATNSPLWWTHSVPTVPPPAANSVVRAVPAVFTPGVPLTVTETVTCDAGIGAYAIEEQPPVGWQVSNISNGGTVDPVNGKVKWGLFLDHTSRVLSYMVTPPAGAAMDGNFAGQGGFDGQLVAIGGPNQTGPPSGVRLVSGFVPGRGFKLDLTGEPGTSQTIEASTNLVDWTTLTTVKLDGSGVGQILDDSATNFPQRFYRSLGAN
ncbi:MAG TPA: hypothetical protein VHI52_06200 [Verrucomicrobiae bacterium]|nr:hypothetical protein [Verrucomicrobiae bacterium]